MMGDVEVSELIVFPSQLKFFGKLIGAYNSMIIALHPGYSRFVFRRAWKHS